METLKLTEDHKDKLLYMCKVLFPEFKIYHKINYGYNTVSNILCVRDTITDHFITEIHWFEFCITHLAQKIIYPLYVPENANSEEGLQIGMETFGNDILYWPKTHPVDYLYLEFLKLKKDENNRSTR